MSLNFEVEIGVDLLRAAHSRPDQPKMYRNLQLDVIAIGYDKGQLISKADWRAIDSPKK